MAQTQGNGNRPQQSTNPQGSNQIVRRDDPSRSMRTTPRYGALSPYYSSNPFGFARRMFDDMERMMDEMMPDFGGMTTGTAGFVPQIDVSRRGENLIVHADLPGLSPEDLKIHVSSDGLILEGERHHEQERDEGDMWRSERSYGRFQRLIPLPEGADLDSAQAHYENGVLEISVKAPEGSRKRREVQIHSGTSNQGASPTKPKS